MITVFTGVTAGLILMGGCAALVLDTAASGLDTKNHTVAEPASSAAKKDNATKGGGKERSGKKRPDGVYSFGKKVRFEDGSTLTAGQPVKFTPDEYSKTKKHAHIKVKVTFVNNSGKVFDPTLTTGSASSGDTEGESVYQEGLDAPDNKLLPGHKVTWWMGYGVDNPKKVTLTVSMGFLDYDDVIYTNE